ncbi:Phox/Bem1p [Artemisia annua]|uniref:Phox/Bem1p n=1 Tax=Artemisia annua TaxID=35608 RepID=A0A2U1MF51_ARTAN|nr:Phox/Bem1p [Artemisia annua]
MYTTIALSMLLQAGVHARDRRALLPFCGSSSNRTIVRVGLQSIPGFPSKLTRSQVKFGDTLRRFNAYTNKKELNYDIITLREHISNLIGFTLDVDYTLAYIDEDKDIVTLHDDNDLSDIAAQPSDLYVRLLEFQAEVEDYCEKTDIPSKVDNTKGVAFNLGPDSDNDRHASCKGNPTTNEWTPLREKAKKIRTYWGNAFQKGTTNPLSVVNTRHQVYGSLSYDFVFEELDQQDGQGR